MSRKVILFGGAGFIGRHYSDFLGKQHLVGSLDISGGGEVVYSDVRQKIELNQNFDKDDVVINLAAIHRTPGHPSFDYFETNIRGAENVCALAERKGINNIIFTSSIAPYGASEPLKTEDTLPTPNTPYGISKLVAEHIHRTWALSDSRRRLLIIRPGVVFGQGENGNFTRLAAAIRRGYFLYPGRLDTIKACIYVKDLVQASWRLLEEMAEGVELYNFTYEPAPTIKEIADKVAAMQGDRPPRFRIPGKMLSLGAAFLQFSGLGHAIGLHPDRVKKLMISTNISGRKLQNRIESFPFGFDQGLRDWYKANEEKGLF